MANIPLTPFGIVGLQKIYGHKFEYRLHEIELTVHKMGEVTATIYDGDRVVFVVHGHDDDQAIRAARAWIDERDEVASEYDLHHAA
ncbi:MAG: hypothetical protein R3A44_27065 [Caldilineaceae bacterium]